MVGIENVTAVTMQNITDLINVTEFPEMAIMVNHRVYGGWLYFWLLLVIWYVMYMKLQDVEDQPLVNLMYGGVVISLASLFLRAIEIVREGVVLGLITDYMMWVFPLITMLLAAVIWMGKHKD